MRRLTARTVAELCGGRLVGDGDVSVGPDVVVDSRLATPGCLFVAVAGERVDGHDFTARAVAAGAAAALVERPVDGAVTPPLTGSSVAQVVVPDSSVAGLSRLAAAVVAEAAERGLATIAITGSSGKTSTKDLLAQVLASAGETVAPVGSFNNEIGVPLTATRVDDRTRFLVSEMGARGPGHIRWLCTITPPQVSVCLNVGHAHVGEFGSVDAIARAKSEIVAALPPSGWAVLNADDPRVRAMAGVTAARVALWSARARPDADLAVWGDDIRADDLQRHSFTLHAARRGAEADQVPVTLASMGRHQVDNALAAACAALTVGLDLPAIAAALSAARPRSRWRMEVTDRVDGVTVINDAYNANPDSMAAALRTLAEVGRARREQHPDAATWAILGDMLELGDTAADEHRSAGRLARDLGIDHVVTHGPLSAQIDDADVHVDTLAQLAGWLDARVRPGDIVLFKASRGIGLETVAEELLASRQRTEAAATSPDADTGDPL